MGAPFLPPEAAEIADVRRELLALIHDADAAADERQRADALARYMRRQLEAAAEIGAAMLAAVDRPRLVTPDFVSLDRAALADALDVAVAALDAIDGDTDIEDGADDEFTGDDELSLGWTARVDQIHLGHDQDDQETTALERHGRGFVRSGPDDAEESDEPEDDELGDGYDTGIGDEDGYHEQAGFAVAGALPWTVGGYVG